MTGEAFVRYIEANLLAKGISKEVFYRDSGITTASMSQWRSGKHTPSQKAIDKVVSFFEKHKNHGMYLAAQELPILSAESAEHIWLGQKEKAPIPEDERDYAQNEHEARMLLLARHIAPIPEEQRNQLIENFASSADIYLKLIKKPLEDQ